MNPQNRLRLGSGLFRLKADAVWIVSAGLLVCALLWPRPAGAVLGEPAASVRADQATMAGSSMTSTTRANYSVEQIGTPWGTVVNEYLSPDGLVFAISWRGPRPPDLSQMLGSYFSDYQAALNQSHQMRRQLRVKSATVVVETGGHMRDLWGRAYVPSLIPSGVTTEEIR
jgi:hypothetical protein